MQRVFGGLVADERGTAAIEYGLVVALISVALIGGLTILGINLRDELVAAAEALATAGS